MILTALGLPTRRPKHLRGYSLAVVEIRLSRKGLDWMVVVRLRFWGEQPVGVRTHLHDLGEEDARSH